MDRPRRRITRRRRGMFEPKRGGSGYGAEFALALVSGGLGYVLADGFDRFLATYNPSSTAAKPTHKFTSDGTGTLANTLNVASTPSFLRIGVGIGLTALPAVGSFFVKNPFVRSSLEGAAIGAGISLFKTFWNNVLMPMFKPKATDTPTLQKSFIARLYPAEVAASINLHATPPQTAATSVAFGALSGGGSPAPAHGGALADVGPYALSAESPYPDSVQALRRQSGVSNAIPGWPGVGEPSPYPDAASALRYNAGLGLGAAVDTIASTISNMVPGITDQHAVQTAAQAVAEPHDLIGAISKKLPHVHVFIVHEIARQVHPHVARIHGANQVTPPAAPPVLITPPVPAVPAAGASPLAPPQMPAMPVPPVAATGVSQPPAYDPGPGSTPGPGPTAHRHESADCGCIGETNPYLGFVGDEVEKDSLFVLKSDRSRAA